MNCVAAGVVPDVITLLNKCAGDGEMNDFVCWRTLDTRHFILQGVALPSPLPHMSVHVVHFCRHTESRRPDFCGTVQTSTAATLTHYTRAILLSISSHHEESTGLRSGEHAGHNNLPTTSMRLKKKALVILLRFDGTLSFFLKNTTSITTWYPKIQRKYFQIDLASQ